jgi:serine/threonine protein kinase
MEMAHRDLKLENLLIDENKDGLLDAFICDFGVSGSRQVQIGEMFVDQVGTQTYWTPELFENELYTEAGDI